MPLIGASYGVQGAQALDAVDKGIDRGVYLGGLSRERELELQNIRALGVNTDNAIDANRRAEDLSPYEVELARYNAKDAGITVDRNTISLTKEQEEERRRQANKDALDKEARLKVQDSVGQLESSITTRPSETASNISGNQANTAENRRLRQESDRRKASEKATAGVRTRTEMTKAGTNELLAEYKLLEQEGILDTAETELSNDELERVNNFMYRALSNNYSMFKAKPQKAVDDFNNMEYFGAEGAVDARVKDGKYEFIDAKGNVVSDKDGDPASFDVAALERNHEKNYDPGAVAARKAAQSLAKDFDPSKYSKELVAMSVQHVTGQTKASDLQGIDDPAARDAIAQITLAASQDMRANPGMSIAEAFSRNTLAPQKASLRELQYTDEQIERLYIDGYINNPARQGKPVEMTEQEFYDYVIKLNQGK